MLLFALIRANWMPSILAIKISLASANYAPAKLSCCDTILILDINLYLAFLLRLA